MAMITCNTCDAEVSDHESRIIPGVEGITVDETVCETCWAAYDDGRDRGRMVAEVIRDEAQAGDLPSVTVAPDHPEFAEDFMAECYEAEQNGRQFSPFEFQAAEFNRSEHSEVLWDLFDLGIEHGFNDVLDELAPEQAPEPPDEAERFDPAVQAGLCKTCGQPADGALVPDPDGEIGEDYILQDDRTSVWIVVGDKSVYIHRLPHGRLAAEILPRSLGGDAFQAPLASATA